MRLLAITDLHGSRPAWERILADAGPVELALLGGDITHFGSPDDAEELVRRARASAGTVLAVVGNCDSPEIARRLSALDVLAHGRGVIHQGVGLHGLSLTSFGQGGKSDASVRELLEAGYAQIAPAERHVLLAHPPPHGTALDRAHSGKHVGSIPLRAFIDRTQPALVFCGHIHEGRGIEQLGRTTAVNCGKAADGHYALAEVGDRIKVALRTA